MIKTTSAIAVLILLVMGSVNAQDEKLELHLKSGDSFEGTLIEADEDGVTLENDGLKVYFKWSYCRGDKHFDLRKTATDFKAANSVIKLADFCHEFAMDEQELDVLKAALKLKPGNASILTRMEALSEAMEPDIPEIEEPAPEEPKEPDPEPEVEKPEDTEPKESDPPPTIPPYQVFLECKDNYKFGAI